MTRLTIPTEFVDVPVDLLEMIADRVAEKIVVGTKLYTPDETAEHLGLSRKAVYDIDPRELVRTPTGPGGGNIMYLGADIETFKRLRRQGGSQ